MTIVISKPKIDDIYQIRDLIRKRINWMDEVGIDQWNNTLYLERYPYDYFVDNIDYFYIAKLGNRIVAFMAAYTEDDRWPDKKNAFYIHHLTADPDYKGVGNQMMDFIESEAVIKGVDYIRLDSAIGNIKLEDYYTKRGYKEYGRCEDGLYKGILREKKVL